MSYEHTEDAATVEVDLALLNEVRRLLESAGFTVADAELPAAHLRWLLAENNLFALAVVTGRTLQDLLSLENYATPVLSERMSGAGAKKWDAYLVLLAREDRDARGTRAVRGLQYDTSEFRRIVGLGVHADERSVRDALRPFLPLPAVSEKLVGPVLSDLIDELVLQGIEREVATAALRRYQEAEVP